MIYRPPHCGYLSDIFNTIADLSALYRHIVILGDFNADLDSQSFDAEQIRTLVNTLHLSLVPYASTHHTRTSSTRLDLCIIDDAEKLISYGQHDVSFLSAHDLIYVEYDLRIKRVHDRCVWVRDFRSFDSERFLDELDSCN